jgi:hypothetical protein
VFVRVGYVAIRSSHLNLIGTPQQRIPNFLLHIARQFFPWLFKRRIKGRFNPKLELEYQKEKKRLTGVPVMISVVTLCTVSFKSPRTITGLHSKRRSTNQSIKSFVSFFITITRRLKMRGPRIIYHFIDEDTTSSSSFSSTDNQCFCMTKRFGLEKRKQRK